MASGVGGMVMGYTLVGGSSGLCLVRLTVTPGVYGVSDGADPALVEVTALVSIWASTFWGVKGHTVSVCDATICFLS